MSNPIILVSDQVVMQRPSCDIIARRLREEHELECSHFAMPSKIPTSVPTNSVIAIGHNPLNIVAHEQLRKHPLFLDAANTIIYAVPWKHECHASVSRLEQIHYEFAQTPAYLILLIRNHCWQSKFTDKIVNYMRFALLAP